MISNYPKFKGLCITFTLALICLILAGCASIGMLNPKGLIASEERKLFFDTLGLMMIVVLPVIIMSFTFIYHYQVSHQIKEYMPNWSHSYFLEFLWWTIPCVIIIILGILTWKKTHELDPYQPIILNHSKPLEIQVIALPWKWLFIYPEENIATVNYVELPVGREVEYFITTDNVPMSAFFIPELGGQIYAMAGMRTRLHLLPTQMGVYDGMNTQYNGDGFSDMHFEVHVVSSQDMQAWVQSTQKSLRALNLTTYNLLLNPTVAEKPQFFAGVENNLFSQVLNLYMTSLGSDHPRHTQLKFHYPVK